MKQESGSRRVLQLASVVMGLGGLWYLFAEAVSAYGFPGYSYAHNFISDLGVPEAGVFQGRAIDSRLAEVMNAGFLGEGLTFALGGVLLWWALPKGRGGGWLIALAAVHSFGISLVGLVNGSPANVEGGMAIFHFAGAFAAIISGNLAVIIAGKRALPAALGPKLSRFSVLLGTVGLVSLLALIVTSASNTIFIFDYGVWERMSVYTIIAWQFVFASATLVSRHVARVRGHFQPVKTTG